MTAIPLVYSFWFMLSAYVVHIIGESLLGGNFFVEKVQQHWWPQYSWRKFFGSTGYLFMMSASIVLYDRIGEAFLFLPLAWAIERFFNAIW